MLGLGTFSVSALVCAVAPSAAVLIAARCVQGIGAGTITPLALTLILPQFPADRRGTAIGLWTATQSAAVAAGPSLGGVLVAAVGWRAVFILQLPIGLAALGGAVWALDRDRPADRGSAPPDLLGVLLLGAAIGLPSLAIVQSHAWGALEWRTDAAFCAGIAPPASSVGASPEAGTLPANTPPAPPPTRARGAGDGAGPRRLALREPSQPELALRLDVVWVVVGRVTRPCDRRCLGRHAEVSQDALDRLPLGDDRQDAKPAVALGAFENVDAEAAPQERRPVQPRRGGVERALEQPAPVVHREDVRRERDDGRREARRISMCMRTAR